MCMCTCVCDYLLVIVFVTYSVKCFIKMTIFLMHKLLIIQKPPGVYKICMKEMKNVFKHYYQIHLICVLMTIYILIYLWFLNSMKNVFIVELKNMYII